MSIKRHPQEEKLSCLVCYPPTRCSHESKVFKLIFKDSGAAREEIILITFPPLLARTFLKEILLCSTQNSSNGFEARAS